MPYGYYGYNGEDSPPSVGGPGYPSPYPPGYPPEIIIDIPTDNPTDADRARTSGDAPGVAGGWGILYVDN